jgi:hypothetical protein
LNSAHEIAYVVTDSGPVLATQFIRCSTHAIQPSTRHIDHANADERKSAPIFNYARVFSWSQYAEQILRLCKRAAANAERKVPFRPEDLMSELSDTFIMVRREHADSGSIVRGRGPDESSMDDEHGEPALPTVRLALPEKPVFATGVFQRVVFATILALSLQWGTTGAAILIHLNTPPKGIGCRGLTFILYGAAGTVSFWLLLLSSMLAHVARQTGLKQRSGMKTSIGYIATLTRWLGKFIAIMNGFGILGSCVLQLAGIYDNCFCSSTILGGDPNGLVSFTAPRVQGSEVYWYWIGGTVIAFGVSALYSFAIYIATPMG